MFAAIVALATVCVVQMAGFAWYVFHSERINQKMRSDLMDRFMESDLMRLKRAQAVEEKPEPVRTVEAEEEEYSELMGARL